MPHPRHIDHPLRLAVTDEAGNEYAIFTLALSLVVIPDTPQDRDDMGMSGSATLSSLVRTHDDGRREVVSTHDPLWTYVATYVRENQDVLVEDGTARGYVPGGREYDPGEHRLIRRAAA